MEVCCTRECGVGGVYESDFNLHHPRSNLRALPGYHHELLLTERSWVYRSMVYLLFVCPILKIILRLLSFDNNLNRVVTYT
jgi:hypothetical protein